MVREVGRWAVRHDLNAPVSVPNNKRGASADGVMQTMNDISPGPLAETSHSNTHHRR